MLYGYMVENKRLIKLNESSNINQIFMNELKKKISDKDFSFDYDDSYVILTLMNPEKNITNDLLKKIYPIKDKHDRDNIIDMYMLNKLLPKISSVSDKSSTAQFHGCSYSTIKKNINGENYFGIEWEIRVNPKKNIKESTEYSLDKLSSISEAGISIANDDRIKSEFTSFLNKLNQDVKKVENEDFRSIKYYISKDPKDISRARVSNNYSLTDTGFVIVGNLGFRGVTYQGKENPFSFAVKFLMSAFKENKTLSDKYIITVSNPDDDRVYLVVNLKNIDLEDMKSKLKASKYYDQYEYPVEYLDKADLKKALRNMVFVEKFAEKFSDKASILFTQYQIEINMDSKNYKSKLIDDLLKENERYESEYEAAIKKYGDNGIPKKEVDRIENDHYDKKEALYNQYKKSTLLPTLNYATKETNIKYKNDISFYYGSHGDSNSIVVSCTAVIKI